MILVALALFGFGTCDLVRWAPGRVDAPRALVSAAAGTVTIGAVAACAGFSPFGIVAVALASLAVLSIWSAYDLLSIGTRPIPALLLVVASLATLAALSGAVDPVGGDLADWYSNLGFGFVRRVPVDQFLLGFGAALFLLATTNRIVRYTLAASAPSLLEGEETMRGGRLLGPMERLVVAASVIAGSIAGAGFVIAAKGLLRFREIRGSNDADKPGIDEITEYFLVGTFASVLVAAALGALILAAS